MAWIEGETLGEVLSSVREDWGRRTPGYLSQLKMAATLEKVHGKYAPSQGTISNIENDLYDIMDLQPDVRLDLLKLYPLKDNQIAELDQRFSLRLAKGSDVKNPTLKRPEDMGKLGGVTVRVLGNPAEASVIVSEFLLQGHEAGNVFAIDTTGAVLACPEVRARYGRRFKVFFSGTKGPTEGDIAAYKVKGEETYILRAYHVEAPRNPVAVTSFDETRIIVLHPNDPETELLGFRVTAWEL